ncbi:MAG: hypothetical protein HW386_1727 [Gammaproteobacteria bacterium]|nr:hypothetical protein [Gammaproteobacteria bacterium]
MESGIFYTGLLTMNPRIPFHFIRATLAWIYTGAVSPVFSVTG